MNLQNKKYIDIRCKSEYNNSEEKFYFRQLGILQTNEFNLYYASMFDYKLNFTLCFLYLCDIIILIKYQIYTPVYKKINQEERSKKSRISKESKESEEI